MSFPSGRRRELVGGTGVLKGLRKDKSVEPLLRVPPLHVGCGHSLRGSVVRAGMAGLADVSAVAPMIAAEEIGGSAARAVRGVVSRTGRRGGGRRRLPGPGVRRDNGRGARQGRLVAAVAPLCPPSFPDLRPLPTHGNERAWSRRVPVALPRPRGRPRARRPRVFDRQGHPSRGGGGRSCHRAREHRPAGASHDRRGPVRPARGGHVGAGRLGVSPYGPITCAGPRIPIGCGKG